MKVLEENNEITTNESDWVLFYTKAESTETKAVVEIIINEVDIKKNTKRQIGLGHAVIPIFYPEMPVSVDVMKGTPREVAKYSKDPSYQAHSTGSILYFDAKQQILKKFEKLMHLIPENIFVGCNDEIPGMDGSRLPPNVDDANLKLKVSSHRTIYAHNIRISSMNEVE